MYDLKHSSVSPWLHQCTSKMAGPTQEALFSLWLKWGLSISRLSKTETETPPMHNTLYTLIQALGLQLGTNGSRHHKNNRLQAFHKDPAICLNSDLDDLNLSTALSKTPTATSGKQQKKQFICSTATKYSIQILPYTHAYKFFNWHWFMLFCSCWLC